MSATPTAPDVVRCGNCHGMNTAITLDTGSGHHYRCCDCFHTWFHSLHVFKVFDFPAVNTVSVLPPENG